MKTPASQPHDPRERIPLTDGARIVVIGGGPAGAFFAIRVLRLARRAGKRIELVILERKHEVSFHQAPMCEGCREGCNYCAGGISPRMAAILRDEGLNLPQDIIVGRARSLTVHGDWKSIELSVPDGKDMLFVFRGSRPHRRCDRYVNFDSYLLGRAIDEGAEVLTAEARELAYTPAGKPIIHYTGLSAPQPYDSPIEADFVVLAAGINQTPGMDPPANSLYRSLAAAMRLRPPRVRKAIIAEMEADEDVLAHMAGEVHFVEYGSDELRIEMSSLIPKGKWLTIALLGRSIDEAQPADYLNLMQRYLDLPHIRRLLPRGARLVPGCICRPNMTVGVARPPYGHRVALIGDMAVSRLYKDGILSAHQTATALADCLVNTGLDRGSLGRGYWPAVRRMHHDNIYGRIVFLLNRVAFAHPVLSRIIYQAVLTERKSKYGHARRLGDLLWKIASGDDSYRRILLSMFHPRTAASILVGGALVTARNWLTEQVFGLNWEGFGRYPTGVPKEDVHEKRLELATHLGVCLTPAPEFERMYSIRIRSSRAEIFRELGRFGDLDRPYLRPRLLRVYRTAGAPNTPGSTIRYDTPFRRLSFSIVLQKAIGERYLLYRVQDGFARGGILVFDVHRQTEGLCLLSIYVAFDFPARGQFLRSPACRIARLFFPSYIHDVLWNHALCELKHAVETGT